MLSPQSWHSSMGTSRMCGRSGSSWTAGLVSRCVAQKAGWGLADGSSECTGCCCLALPELRMGLCPLQCPCCGERAPARPAACCHQGLVHTTCVYVVSKQCGKAGKERVNPAGRVCTAQLRGPDVSASCRSRQPGNNFLEEFINR